MLKHQEDPIPAPQIRVTPEELSEALAAIEARKQAEASRLAGTIPIEQAVSELHLDSSPEEIWTEVQAGRAKAQAAQDRAAAEAARQAQDQQAQARQQVAAPQWVTAPPRQKRRRGLRIFLPLLGIWTVFHFGLIPNIFGHHHVTINQAFTVDKAQMTPLSQIPDGTEAYADSASLVQLSEGKPLTQVFVDKTQGDNTWAVFKRGGHIYLRGYTPQTASLKAITGEALTVYNTDDSDYSDELEGGKTSSITLRVDSVPLQESGGGDDFSEVTLPNFQPDPVTTLTPWR